MSTCSKRQEVVSQLTAMLTDRYDPEAQHSTADLLLVEYLREIGETEIADAFEKARGQVPFWYS